MVPNRKSFSLPVWLPSLALGFTLGLGLGPASPASANDSAERAAALNQRAERSRAVTAREAEQREEWQTNYRKLLVELRSARENQNAATIERRRDRKDYRLRGALRVASDQKIEDAEKQRQAVYEELIDFYDRARAGAVEPGWLRQVEEDFPELFDALPDRG